MIALGGEKSLKTFKMLSFEIEYQKKIQSIPLIDGLIINQENSHQLWTVELFISKQYEPIFQQLLEDQTVIKAQVVISFPDNDPAYFLIVVTSIHHIGDNISVLLKGRITQKKRQYAELLLEKLLAQDLTKDELLHEFEIGLRERPKL